MIITESYSCENLIDESMGSGCLFFQNALGHADENILNYSNSHSQRV